MKFSEIQCLTISACLKFIVSSLYLIIFLLKSFYYFLHNIMFRRMFSTLVEQQSISQDFLNSQPNPTKIVSALLAEPSLSWLQFAAPCFPVKGEKVTVIKEPGKFYETLVEKSASAKKRVILASLYLGTGQLESTLVQTIQRNLQKNKFLKVDVLLDFTRGTRGEYSSKSMLLPLIQEFNGNFTLSMYHTPDLRGITKKLAPPRWNELLGLQHMKVYLFDDSVMISGANLSNDYFTNRQDRYILIEDKCLADFYAKFIGKVQQFSLSIQSDSEAVLHKGWEILPYEGYKHDFTSKAKTRIVELFNEVMEEQKLAIERQVEEGADTWIFPLVEMGQIGIHHDSVVTRKLLQSSVEGSEFKLATGYFNLTQDYMDILTSQCVAQCSLLMAHPNVSILFYNFVYIRHVYGISGALKLTPQRALEITLNIIPLKLYLKGLGYFNINSKKEYRDSKSWAGK